MKQKLLLLLALVAVAGILIGLNAAAYVQKETVPDTELSPNRSTYNAGVTGTRAFFELLHETGRSVTRWQQPPQDLLTAGIGAPTTFVVIGPVKREFSDDESMRLLQWVANGNTLVLIDRKPPSDLFVTTANWSLSVTQNPRQSLLNTDPVDPADPLQMTSTQPAAKPVQPTLLTRGVNAVQPSRFTSWASFSPIKDYYSAPQTFQAPANVPRSFYRAQAAPQMPPPIAIPTPTPVEPADEHIAQDTDTGESAAMAAPVSHVSVEGRDLLVDVPYGSGRIIYLSDPFVVSNGGISMADNAQLAINIVTTTSGPTAFDEYHHGYGRNNNRLLEYFSGTPVTAIFLQLAVLAGLIFYTKGRRFARPLPETEPDRLSKLEYVSAMAEMQLRTKAYDLAMENIFADFRRRATRSLGVDNYKTTRRELADLIAERTGRNADEVHDLLYMCEALSQGEETNRREVLDTAARLRELERELGLRRTGKGRV